MTMGASSVTADASTQNIQLMGAAGVEPVFTAPKAVVLPLDEAPTNSKRGVALTRHSSLAVRGGVA